MANFKIAYNRTAVNEGGYTNNPDDNGNWTGGQKGLGVLIGTNNGVSAPVLRAFLNRTPSVAEMKSLTSETAMAIYKKNYWDVIRGDEVNSQDIANNIYDMAVNAGCVRAMKLWQESIKIRLSGIMDEATLRKTNLQI